MSRKCDSKFTKDLSVVYYGTDGLKKKCLDKSRVQKDRETREQISPEKLQIMSGKKI